MDKSCCVRARFRSTVHDSYSDLLLEFGFGDTLRIGISLVYTIQFMYYSNLRNTLVLNRNHTN